MADDKALPRYFAMLGFFTFSMLGIIMADNLLMIFVFWELVGFSSYMLIGHWMHKPEAAAASKKAFIFNRIGDAGFLIGLMIIWGNTGSFHFDHILSLSADHQAWQTVASLCLFCGVIGKSAQFPLLTWLPDAMEGPTPVSALIHAATMVAAGVYLLAKLFFLFTPEALNVVIITGALTALMASCSALVQTDIKKILAYSTISQLGFMIIAIGAGARDAAMMHLFTHAFFKAGLFLGAGAVIHSLHQLAHQSHHAFDVQDMRNMGGLKKYLPTTFATFLICGAALSGLPFFSGFLSKDAILTATWMWKGDELSWKWSIVAIAFAIPFLTACYTFRLIWFVFFGTNRTAKISEHSITLSDAPPVMRLPLIILAMASFWIILSWNPFHYSGWLYTHLHNGNEAHNSSITLFSITLVLIALVVAYFYFRNKSLSMHPSKGVFFHSFYLDRIYHQLVTLPVQKFSALTTTLDLKWIDGFIHATVYIQVTVAHCLGWFDKNVVDGTVNGVTRVAGSIGSMTRSFQGGKIQLYIFWGVFGIIIFILSMLI